MLGGLAVAPSTLVGLKNDIRIYWTEGLFTWSLCGQKQCWAIYMHCTVVLCWYEDVNSPLTICSLTSYLQLTVDGFTGDKMAADVKVKNNSQLFACIITSCFRFSCEFYWLVFTIRQQAAHWSQWSWCKCFFWVGEEKIEDSGVLSFLEWKLTPESSEPSAFLFQN